MDSKTLAAAFAAAAEYAIAQCRPGLVCAIEITPHGFMIRATLADGQLRHQKAVVISFKDVFAAEFPFRVITAGVDRAIQTLYRLLEPASPYHAA